MSDALIQFIHRFDLEPKGFRAVITDWEYISVPDKVNPMIIIRNIDIHDLDGNFIRAADMSTISKNMEKFAFSFKKK